MGGRIMRLGMSLFGYPKRRRTLQLSPRTSILTATFSKSLREVDILETPDRVAYNDSALDVERLDELLAEIA